MAFNKITENDLLDKGVVGLPDTPALNTADMQAKFDEIATDVIVPKFNALVDSLNGSGVADNSQVTDPTSEETGSFQSTIDNLKLYTDTEITAQQNYTDEEIAEQQSYTDNAKAQCDASLLSHTDDTENPHGVTAEQIGAYTKTEMDTSLGNKVDKVTGKALSTNDYDNTEKSNVAENTTARHTHANKSVLDAITSALMATVQAVSTMFASITGVVTSVIDDDSKIPTSGAIVDYVSSLGGGDMTKAVYDADNDGVVDNAEALQGHPASYFGTATELATETENLNAEITRATNAESALSTDILSEASRATGVEGTLADDIAAEVARATEAENTIKNNLSLLGNYKLVGSGAVGTTNYYDLTDDTINNYKYVMVALESGNVLLNPVTIPIGLFKTVASFGSYVYWTNTGQYGRAKYVSDTRIQIMNYSKDFNTVCYLVK